MSSKHWKVQGSENQKDGAQCECGAVWLMSVNQCATRLDRRNEER